MPRTSPSQQSTGIASAPSPAMDENLDSVTYGSSPSAAAAAAAAAAAKKKKKKGKGKRADETLDSASNHAFAATAQAQADLIATASDLYRRIEADPQGIPDDDAYWTSLPAHLRTFIRNALPIGQLPQSTQANPNDPNARQASTNAMIAVAQQLAQAAHASQRHLQQHPAAANNGSNGNAYTPFPFDPSIFADLALHADQSLPLHPHPNSAPTLTNGTAYSYGGHIDPAHGHGEGDQVVMMNEYNDGRIDYEDEYYSDEELDAHEGVTLDSRDAHEHYHHEQNGHLPTEHVDTVPSSKKKNKKKKKKGGGGAAAALTGDDNNVNGASLPPAAQLPASVPKIPDVNATKQAQQYATTDTHASIRPPAVAPAPAPPPPSSRAAGKQPMTFSSAAGKAPAPAARPAANGGTHGKRPASAATSSHGHGSVNGPLADAHSWATSSLEERERIKSFWMALNDRERRNLIKTEKDQVLKRIREQQKHGCTCAVCSRKKRSIEQELEVLYDAYYTELDSFARLQQKHVESNGQSPAPPGPGPFPGSVTLDKNGAVIEGDSLSKASAKRGHIHHHAPALGKRTALPPEDDDGYEDDELDDDEYDDEYEYEDEEDEEDDLDEPDVKPPTRRRGIGADPRSGATRTIGPGAGVTASNGDYLSVGSSLTVKGILTVADDLLRNDGQKFLEMMEQLAERRAQHDNSLHDADDVSIDGETRTEDPVEDEEEPEERMEEGRRMFHIFAARMFEQRVLHAYRERIAQERQLQLLRELEEESMAEKEKEAKRQKEQQKKKDKKKQAKQKQEEERLRRESEKAAEEAAAREKLEKQREAELKRQEEVRLKRDAERRVKEEERARKEEEKRKRQEEERARELEKERKKREREEKARSDREAKEREQKAKEEEARLKREKAEATAKAAEEERQREKTAETVSAPSRGPANAALSSAPASPSSTKASASADSTVQPQPGSPAAARSRTASAASPSAQSSLSTRSVQQSKPPLGVARPAPAAASTTTSAPAPSVSSSAATPSSSSSLPAPPQGLPPRPLTNATPHASVLPASLPRPPVQQAQMSFGTSSQVGSSSGTLSKASTTGLSPTLSSATLQSTHSGTSQPAEHMAASPITASQQAQSPFVQGQQPSGQNGLGQAQLPRFGSAAPNFGASPIRSPNAAVQSGALPPMGGKVLEMASPTGFGSSNVSTMGFNSVSSTGGQQPSHAQPPFGAIGGGMPSAPTQHTRAASQDELSKAGSNMSRPISRPAPGPIGPIGRPRDLAHEDHAASGIGMSGTSSIFGNSSAFPEGILGSSALSGDDELVEPQPRRISNNNAPVSAGGNSSSFFGSSNRNAFGAPSPWVSSGFGSASSSSASGMGGGRAPSASVSSAGQRTPSLMNTTSLMPGAVGSGISLPSGLAGAAATSAVPGSQAFGPLGNTGLSHQQLNGSAHLLGAAGGSGGNNYGASNTAIGGAGSGAGNVSWSRAGAGWDRARSAFESPATSLAQQTSPIQGHGGQQQQQPQSMHQLHAHQMSQPHSHNQYGQQHDQLHGQQHSSPAGMFGTASVSSIGPLSPYGNGGAYQSSAPYHQQQQHQQQQHQHQQQAQGLRSIFGTPGASLPLNERGY